jgi:peroxiredoxin
MLKRFLLLSVLLVLPLASGCRFSENARAADALKLPVGFRVGERAPDFDLLSVGQGKSIRSDDLRGRPVIINFFCGCNFCSTVAREWAKNKDEVGDVPIVAIAANHWTYAPAAVREFRAKTGWPWPMLADMASRTANDFDALTCPRLFVLDSEGVIRYASEQGASDEKALVAAALAAAHAR